jgi:hypothetical protein
MRNLINIISEDPQLKKEIIQQIKKTDDEELLDRIYTVLNQSGLTDRISGTLERETDTVGYVADLTKIIIDTPGTYQEKHNFINGFPKGYVDIKLMLSGERVKYIDLLTGDSFVSRVFDKLKRVTFGTAKGPGEFALAVMSPHIKITGKGDLNIGKDIIEVKASAGKEVSSGGGRLGTPGLLQSDNVETIIADTAENLGIDMATAIPDGNLSLRGLIALTSNSKPAARKQLADDLFSYIFKGQVSVTKLVSAFVSGDYDLFKQEYIKANYALYQEDSGFTGVMLMNFALGELQYYRTPDEMLKHIYEPGVYLISNDKAAQARQILSQVTLRPFKEPPLVIPDIPQATKGKRKPGEADTMQLFTNYATAWARKYGLPSDPRTIENIAITVLGDKQKGIQNKTIEAKLKKLIALLKPTQNPAQSTKVAPRAAPATVVPPSQQVAQRQRKATVNPPRQRR